MSDATIKDIARETGLSPATISKYLNGGKVRPDNRAAIQAAIEKYDYHPNESARSVRGVSRKIIAVVIPAAYTNYTRLVFLTCQQELIKHDYGVMLINYNNDPHHEQVAVSTAVSNSVSGIISMPMNTDAECYRRAIKNNIPLLFIHYAEHSGAHNILLKDHDTFSEIVAALCDSGHKRIGIISGTTEQHLSDSRINIFKKLLADHNRSLPEELVYTSSDFPMNAGYDGMEYMLSLRPRPTAVVCFNSILTTGAKMAALEHHLRIPADISIAGMTESTITESPVLRNITSISFPVAEAAEEAVRVIMKSIENRQKGQPDELVTIGFNSCVHWAGSIATLA